MKLRVVAEDTASRYLMVVGVVAVAGDFVLTYVDTGRLDPVGVIVQVVFVAVIGVAPVAYWGYMERRADAERGVSDTG